MVKQYNTRAVKAGFYLASLLLTSLPNVLAAEYEPYKVYMSRTEPQEPISMSSIMEEVKRRWPGQVLHIRSDRSGGEDCHIVNMMGDDGEFRIIHVACSN